MPIFLRESKLFPVKAGGLQSRVSENRNVRVFYKNSHSTSLHPLCPSTLLFPLLDGSAKNEQFDTKTCRILLVCLKKWPKWFFLLLIRQRLTGCFPFWSVELIPSLVVMYSLGRPRAHRLTLHYPCNLVTFAGVLPVYHYFMKPRVQWIIQKPLYEVFNASTNVSSNWRYHQETSGTCGYSDLTRARPCGTKYSSAK